MKIREILDEHAVVIDPEKGRQVFVDPDKRKRFQRIIKTMKKLGAPRSDQLRQVKSYKMFKTIGETLGTDPKQQRRELSTDFSRYQAQGRDAFRSGIARDANPYINKDWKARENWFAGWDEQSRKQ